MLKAHDRVKAIRTDPSNIVHKKETGTVLKFRNGMALVKFQNGNYWYSEENLYKPSDVKIFITQIIVLCTTILAGISFVFGQVGELELGNITIKQFWVHELFLALYIVFTYFCVMYLEKQK